MLSPDEVGRKMAGMEVKMTQKELKTLLEYSCSLPTGTIIGKCWRRNKNFFTGGDIIPRREEGLPPERQFGPETAEMAVALSQNTGGLVSPRLIEFAIEDYLAGSGQNSNYLLDIGLHHRTKDTHDITTIFGKLWNNDTNTYCTVSLNSCSCPNCGTINFVTMVSTANTLHVSTL